MFCILVQVLASEETFFLFLIFGSTKFTPPKNYLQQEKNKNIILHKMRKITVHSAVTPLAFLIFQRTNFHVSF